jgi:hypothetical protein
MNNLDEERLQTHVAIVGWLHIAGSALMLVLACFVLALLAGIGFASGDPDAVTVLTIVGSAVGVFLAVLGIPGIVAGYGVLRRRNWGRVLALVVSFLNLFNFPLGTAVGVYSGWVLLQDSASEVFS